MESLLAKAAITNPLAEMCGLTMRVDLPLTDFWEIVKTKAGRQTNLPTEASPTGATIPKEERKPIPQNRDTKEDKKDLPLKDGITTRTREEQALETSLPTTVMMMKGLRDPMETSPPTEGLHLTKLIVKTPAYYPLSTLA